MQEIKEQFDKDWLTIIERLKKLFGKIPDLNALLFLIGVQELGKGAVTYSKEQKQDLMHVGLCTILIPSGYYQLSGVDAEGWPIFEALKTVPKFSLSEQEFFIKTHIKEYFSYVI